MANIYSLNKAADAEPAETDGEEASPQLILTAFMAMPNMVPALQDRPDRLSSIGQLVVEEYEIDDASRAEWKERIDAAMKLAMLVSEVKTYPWPKSSNIKFPLLTTAALQFNARAYPAIVQGNRVVRCQTWGRDPNGRKAARGDRVSEFMSYQLLAQMPEWEEDTDRLLIILPIVGACFRKVYYDPSLKRNTTRLVTADRMVVNYHARSMEDVPRKTEEMLLYPYEIKERIRDGRFIAFEYGNAPSDVKADGKTAQRSDMDKDAPHLFLEQHRLLDLDEDGYPEPYIVTVHHSTQKVCRIVANFSKDTVQFNDAGQVAAIRTQQYYVRYQFMPSPDGGFYGMGLGWLTKDVGEAINTLLNQMVDAGHLSVVQGGFVSSQAGIKEKRIVLSPGEWRVLNTSVPMNQALAPVNYPGPSAVLFNLLGLLIDAGRDITSVKDVLTGEGQGKNASPTTTMALIEQGLQQFTAIYKRIHRALKKEFGILAALNYRYVSKEQYIDFFDEGQPQPGTDPQSMQAQSPGMGHNGGPPLDPKVDFNETDMDIVPVSDPAMVTKMQKLAQAQFVMETAKENQAVNQQEAVKRVFEAAGVDRTEELIMPPPQPDPEVVELTKRGAVAEVMEKEAGVKLKDAQAKLALAQADAVGPKAEVEAEKARQSQQKMDDELALGAEANDLKREQIAATEMAKKEPAP